jgi:hypothetical protein
MRTPITLWSATGAVLLLALTACGGGSSSSDSSSAAVAATPAASAAASGAAGGRPDFAAYRDCLAKNGVTLPEGGQGGPAGGGFPSGVPSGFPSGAPGAFPSGAAPSGARPGGGFPLPDGVDQATYDKAQAACASVRPSFGPGGGGRPALDQTAVAAFKSCLSDHAVTVPDGDNWMQQLDRTDATVKAALDTCSPLLPQPGASQ